MPLAFGVVILMISMLFGEWVMLGDKKRVEVSGVMGRESSDSSLLGKLESRLGYDKCESCKCCVGESCKVESCEVKSNKADSS